MSIDVQIEQKAYSAVNEVCNMPWPVQRERVLLNIIKAIMIKMNWETVTFRRDLL